MNRNLSVLLIGFILCNSGCTLAVNTVRNLSNEIYDCKEECRARIRDRRSAKSAWKDYQATNAGVKCSADFGEGFQEGYVGCLEAGGDSIPPSFPPCHCTRRHWGPRAVEDWYAGFSSGVAGAQRRSDHEPMPGISPLMENAEPRPLMEPVSAKPLARMQKPGSPYATYPHWDPRAVEYWHAGFSSGVAVPQRRSDHEPIPGISPLGENTEPLPLAEPMPLMQPVLAKPLAAMEKPGSPYATYPH